MRRHLILLFGTGTLLLAGSAPGDWLVMRDGTRLETLGPWEVKGQQVVFTHCRPAALRLAAVDLEASEAASAEPAPPPVAGPEDGPTRREPLAGKDLQRRTIDPGEEAEQNPEPDGDSATSDEPVRLVDWNSSVNADLGGLEITGTVRNSGDEVAGAVSVTVTVLGGDGDPYPSRAFLQQSALAPGGSSTFRALLPGIFALVEDPTFEIRSEGLSIRGWARPEGTGDDEDGEDGRSDDGPPP